MENRVHERVEYRTKVEVYRYYNMSGELTVLEEPMRMEVYDVSISGLGILSHKEHIQEGTLEFTFYLEEIPYRVMARIVWVDHNNIFFRYGLEIIGHNNMLFRHLKDYIERKGTSIHTGQKTMVQNL